MIWISGFLRLDCGFGFCFVLCLSWYCERFGYLGCLMILLGVGLGLML